MYEFALPLLVFLAVVSLGGAVLTARSARRRRVRARMAGFEQPSAEPKEHPPLKARMYGGLAAVGRAVSSGQTSKPLRENLAKAGYYGTSAASVFLGAKILLFVAGAVGLGLLALVLPIPLPLRVLVVVSGCGLLFLLPNMIVSHRRSQRAMRIRQQLPDAVDLLEICVSSGMPLDTAWNLVGDEVRNVNPDFADEIALTNLEIHLGASRADAMRHMGERTGVDALKSLAAVIVQSEQFGTSMAEALRSFTTFLREGRSAAAEEASEKMAVKLLLPMILFIFPVVFVVLVGPAGIRLARIIGGGG
jgi:tight adherence protein C